MDANQVRQLGWLWKWRHKHDEDPDVQEQITIINNQIGQISDAGVGTGAYLHLTRATTQEIAVGGEPIEWTTAYSTIPAFEFDDTVPVTAVPISKSSYYDILIDFTWNTWTGGGSVHINRIRDGVSTLVWPSPLMSNWMASSGRKFAAGVAKGIPFQVGDTFEVVADHGDASPQDLLTAVLVVELVDRYTVEPPPEPGPEQLFVYTEDDTFDWAAAGSPATVDVWIIAGGGGGATSDSSSFRGGGGGAGGVEILTNYAVSGNCAVVVGLGGAGDVGGAGNGDNGEDSSFDGQTADGGGGGGSSGNAGSAGGSGGGGSTFDVGGVGTSGQGNAGGEGLAGGGTRTAGGGGGYGAVGQDGDTSTGKSGDGGIGIDLTAIVGTSYGEAGWFAGGGGGGSSTPTSGGTGGGGNGGNSPQDGQTNTGGGGGGRTIGGTAGSGGSGIVIVRVGA